MDFAGDPSFAGGGEHVDFAADAEFGEVDAGLDGETGVGEDETLVVGFEVVEVCAGAVDFVADIMTRAVGEVFSKAGVNDDAAGGVISLVAVDGAVGGEGLFYGGDSGVAGGGDGGEDFLFDFCGLAADDGGPGDVVVDAGDRDFIGLALLRRGFTRRALGWVVEAAPDVDEEKVAVFDLSTVLGGGVVMRIRRVLVDADVRAVLPGDALRAHLVAEPFFEVVLGEGGAGGRLGIETAADFKPGFGDDAVNNDAGLVVGLLLGFGEDGFELADQICRADDLFADGAQVLDGAGIDHGDVDDGVVGGVLHGDAVRSAQDGCDSGGELLPTGVGTLLAGEGV